MSSQGPNICGTGADDAAVGTVSWSGPTSITADDGSNSSATGGGSNFSHYLKATNFGFSIPSGAIIDGIEVIFERFFSIATPTDTAIKIVKGGTIGGTNRSAGATWSSSAGTTNTFGSPTDTWGETWLYSDINASNFGAVLQVQLGSGMTIANVDRVSIKVYYHTAAGVAQFCGTTNGNPYGTGSALNMQKNVSGQKIGAQMVAAADGSAFTSGVTVYVTGDAGTQAIGSVGSGACTHEGNGYHTYAPSQAETNYDLIAFTFIGTGAIPTTIQVSTLQDANVKQWLGGTPSALSSGNVQAIVPDTQKVDLNTIKTQTVTCSGGVTIPAATLASTTNITAGTITTATNVTTVNGMSAAALAQFFTLDTTKVYSDAVNGSVVKELATHSGGASAPTAAQVATAVWQDTTPGDFTVSGSIGKSLFTSGNVPGAAGGLFIAGTNAATVITTSLTTHLVGTVDTVTTLTNLPAAPTDWVSSASVSSAAVTKIQNGLATPTNITAGTITTATNVTTVNGLAANVITASSIATDAITAAKIADGAIDAATFAAGAINAAAIATDAIAGAKVAADAVTKIQTGLATPTNITAGTITTVTNVTNVNGLASGVITATSIAADAITAAKIADGAIDRATFAVDTGMRTVRSGTAQDGASSSITLDASASATANAYKDCWIYLTGGTGVGQARLCTVSNGTSKVADVAPNWVINPDSSTTFAILPAGQIGGVTGNLTGNVTGNLGGTVALTSDYDAAKVAASQSSVNDIPTNAELATALGTSDDAVLTAIADLENVSAAQVAAQIAAYDAPTFAEMQAAFTEIKGASWTSDSSLKAIRDRGDSAWVTATGFSTLDEVDIRDAVGLGAADLDDQLAALVTIKERTDNLPDSPAGVGDAMTLTAAYNAAKTAATQTSVDDLPTNAELATALAGADDAVLSAIAGLNNVSTAQIAAQIAAYDAPTFTEMVAAFTEIKGATWAATDTLEAIRDRGDAAWITGTGFSTHSAADVWAVATRVLTAGTNIVLAKGVGVTGFNDLSAAAVNAEVDTAISDAALATAADLTSVSDQVDAIVADTNELQTDWANGGRLDLILDARASQASVDDVPTNAEFAAAIAAADDAVLAQLTAMKGSTFDTSTDSLEALRNRGDAAWVTATGFATASALATVSGKVDDVQTAASAILIDTNELQTDWANGGRLDLILDARASQSSVDDVPTNAEFAARTLLAADYFDPTTDVVAHVTLVDTLTTYTNNTPQSGDTYGIVNHGTYGNAQLLRTSAYTAPANSTIATAAASAAAAAASADAIDQRLPASPAATGDAMALTSDERTTLAGVIWNFGSRTLTGFGTLIADIWSYATRLLSTPPPTTAEIATALFVDGASNKLKVNADHTAETNVVMSSDDIEALALQMNAYTAGQIAAALTNITTVQLVGPMVTGEAHLLVLGSAYLHSIGTAPFVRPAKALYNLTGATAAFWIKLDRQTAVSVPATIISYDADYYEIYADIASDDLDELTKGKGHDQFWVMLAGGAQVCVSHCFIEVIDGIARGAA